MTPTNAVTQQALQVLTVGTFDVLGAKKAVAQAGGDSSCQEMGINDNNITTDDNHNQRRQMQIVAVLVTVLGGCLHFRGRM